MPCMAGPARRCNPGNQGRRRFLTQEHRSGWLPCRQSFLPCLFLVSQLFPTLPGIPTPSLALPREAAPTPRPGIGVHLRRRSLRQPPCRCPSPGCWAALSGRGGKRGGLHEKQQLPPTIRLAPAAGKGREHLPAPRRWVASPKQVAEGGVGWRGGRGAPRMRGEPSPHGIPARPGSCGLGRGEAPTWASKPGRTRGGRARAGGGGRAPSAPCPAPRGSRGPAPPPPPAAAGKRRAVSPRSNKRFGGARREKSEGTAALPSPSSWEQHTHTHPRATGLAPPLQPRGCRAPGLRRASRSTAGRGEAERTPPPPLRTHLAHPAPPPPPPVQGRSSCGPRPQPPRPRSAAPPGCASAGSPGPAPRRKPRPAPARRALRRHRRPTHGRARGQAGTRTARGHSATTGHGRGGTAPPPRTYVCAAHACTGGHRHRRAHASAHARAGTEPAWESTCTTAAHIRVHHPHMHGRARTRHGRAHAAPPCTYMCACPCMHRWAQPRHGRAHALLPCTYVCTCPHMHGHREHMHPRHAHTCAPPTRTRACRWIAWASTHTVAMHICVHTPMRASARTAQAQVSTGTTSMQLRIWPHMHEQAQAWLSTRADVSTHLLVHTHVCTQAT